MLRSMKKTSDGCCPPSTNGCSWIEVLLEYPTRENSLFPRFTAMNNNLKVCFDLNHALYKLRTSIISNNPNLRTAIINSLALLRARTSTFEHLFTILTAECIIVYVKFELSRGDAVVRIRVNESRKFPLRLE